MTVRPRRRSARTMLAFITAGRAMVSRPTSADAFKGAAQATIRAAVDRLPGRPAFHLPPRQPKTKTSTISARVFPVPGAPMTTPDAPGGAPTTVS